MAEISLFAHDSQVSSGAKCCNFVCAIESHLYNVSFQQVEPFCLPEE